MTTLRRLIICFALGAILLVAKHALFPAPRLPTLVVDLPANADAATLRRASIEAALIDEALRSSWPASDPVIHERLRETAPSTLTALARIDPATRARLVWLGRELVRSRITARAPSPPETTAYAAAHPHRYAPGWLSFRQLTISRARHGSNALADARALLAQLAPAPSEIRLGTGSYIASARPLVGAGIGCPKTGQGMNEGSAAYDPGTCPHGGLGSAGDPTMLPGRMAAAPTTIDARFGVGFAAQVEKAPVGRWSGPYEGAFGFHVVWREKAEAPEGDEGRVVKDWAHDAREEDVRVEIERMVASRRVVVRRMP